MVWLYKFLTEAVTKWFAVKSYLLKTYNAYQKISQ